MYTLYKVYYCSISYTITYFIRLCDQPKPSFQSENPKPWFPRLFERPPYLSIPSVSAKRPHSAWAAARCASAKMSNWLTPEFDWHRARKLGVGGKRSQAMLPMFRWNQLAGKPTKGRCNSIFFQCMCPKTPTAVSTPPPPPWRCSWNQRTWCSELSGFGGSKMF